MALAVVPAIGVPVAAADVLGVPAAAADGEAAADEAPVNPYEEYGDITTFGPTRRFAVRVCANPDFELLVTLVIFGNCISLSLYDPMQLESSPHNQALFWTGRCRWTGGARRCRNGRTRDSHAAVARGEEDGIEGEPES